MWAPKFAFNWHEPTDDGDEAAARPPVTAHAMLRWALIVGSIALVVFVSAPKTDLAVAHAFYLGNHQFIGKKFLLIPVIRWVFIIFFYLVCALTLVGLVKTIRTGKAWLDLGLNKWLFVTLCLITGPLLVTNIGFKDHWGRARPRDVVEFNGAKAFSGPFPPAAQCEHNCSFVSGEASSTFIVLFAAALLFAPYSRKLVALGIVLGGLTGLMRMAQGGHFLSDVIFAGVFMAITAACLKIAFETLGAEGAPSAKPGVA